MNEDSKIKMEDIILISNDIENIENMAIDVDQDSFRNNPKYAKNHSNAPTQKVSAPPSKMQEKMASAIEG